MVKFEVFRGGDTGITKSTTEKELGPDEVLIKVTHSGLCGTDVHYKGAGMVLGHEAAGIVEDVGKDVTRFKKGDRAGWGYQHNSCLHCKHCLSGAETFCPDRKIYGSADLDQGSFASHGIWKEAFIYAIPDGLAAEHAAPLMCGGASVFTILHESGIRPTDRVGIIGIGGLGHLAIQFAAKMGCEVVVFSGTDSKKDEALKLGAKEFYATQGGKEIKIEKKVDHLLVTSSAKPDWAQFTPVLEARGTIYVLTVSDGELTVPYQPFVMNGWRIQSSMVAARQTHKEMLRFAAIHGIKPIVQTFPLSVDGINVAFKTLEEGKMRYRGVLVAQ